MFYTKMQYLIPRIISFNEQLDKCIFLTCYSRGLFILDRFSILIKNERDNVK